MIKTGDQAPELIIGQPYRVYLQGKHVDWGVLTQIDSQKGECSLAVEGSVITITVSQVIAREILH